MKQSIYIILEALGIAFAIGILLLFITFCILIIYYFILFTKQKKQNFKEYKNRKIDPNLVEARKQLMQEFLMVEFVKNMNAKNSGFN